MPVRPWSEIKHKGGPEALERARARAADLSDLQAEEAAIVRCAGCPRILRVVTAFPFKAWAHVDVKCPCGTVATGVPIGADEYGAPLPWRIEAD